MKKYLFLILISIWPWFAQAQSIDIPDPKIIAKQNYDDCIKKINEANKNPNLIIKMSTSRCKMFLTK